MVSAVLIAESFTLQIKFSIGNSVYNFCPNSKCFISNLCEVVKANECDVTIFRTRCGIDNSRFIVPHIAEVTVLETQHFFTEKFFIQANWVGVLVNHKIINRLDASCIEPANSANDDWRGFMANDVHNVISSVS